MLANILAMLSARATKMNCFLGRKTFLRVDIFRILIGCFCLFSLLEASAQGLSARAGALAKGTNQEVSLSFSAPVDSNSALDPINYSINAGNIEGIRFISLANATILTVSGLITNNSYTVTVSNIVAIDPNTAPITQTNLTFTAREMTWAGIGRNETGIPQDVIAVGTNGFNLVSGALTFFSIGARSVPSFAGRESSVPVATSLSGLAASSSAST